MNKYSLAGIIVISLLASACSRDPRASAIGQFMPRQGGDVVQGGQGGH